MSFASDVKKELCSNTAVEPQQLRAECYGMMLFSKHFSAERISLKTENPYTAARFADLASVLFSPLIEKKSTLKPRKNNARLYTVSLIHPEECAKIFDDFGHMKNQVSLRVNRANLDQDELAAAFLRGVFLSCGSITDPEKGYHLEFSVPYQNLSRDLSKLISEIPQCSIAPSVINRGGSFVTYIKGSEQITDLLIFIGAGNSAMEIMGAKAVKELRNQINRKRNSEVANIEKVAAASAKQINAIEKIKKHKEFENMPEDLKELALLRLENPDMSLRELGKHLSPPISRSGANHRMMRILEWAQDL